MEGCLESPRDVRKCATNCRPPSPGNKASNLEINLQRVYLLAGNMGRAYTLVSSVAGEDQNEKWKIFDEKQLEAAVNNNYDSWVLV